MKVYWLFTTKPHLKCNTWNTLLRPSKRRFSTAKLNEWELQPVAQGVPHDMAK